MITQTSETAAISKTDCGPREKKALAAAVQLWPSNEPNRIIHQNAFSKSCYVAPPNRDMEVKLEIFGEAAIAPTATNKILFVFP